LFNGLRQFSTSAAPYEQTAGVTSKSDYNGEMSNLRSVFGPCAGVFTLRRDTRRRAVANHFTIFTLGIIGNYWLAVALHHLSGAPTPFAPSCRHIHSSLADKMPS